MRRARRLENKSVHRADWPHAAGGKFKRVYYGLMVRRSDRALHEHLTGGYFAGAFDCGASLDVVLGVMLVKAADH